MKEKYFLLPAKSSREPVTCEVDDSDLLHELQKLVGGYIECVPLPDLDDLIALVNDESLVNGAAIYNARASGLADQSLFGDVVIGKAGVRDGEEDIVGLNEYEIMLLTEYVAVYSGANRAFERLRKELGL